MSVENNIKYYNICLACSSFLNDNNKHSLEYLALFELSRNVSICRLTQLENRIITQKLRNRVFTKAKEFYLLERLPTCILLSKTIKVLPYREVCTYNQGHAPMLVSKSGRTIYVNNCQDIMIMDLPSI